MQEKERLERIKEEIAKGLTTITAEDAGFLLNLATAQAARLAELEKKNTVLAHHVMELTEELENVKMDFGGNSGR